MAPDPLSENKDYDAPSVFEPMALLREARRQKSLPEASVPAVCVLDPDGDIVRHLKASGRAQRAEAWPCYHTDLFEFPLAGRPAGIIGCAVGAPFAVLIAEQLFASGCRMLISVTSAGQIVPAGTPPYFVVIDRALRDEGTSRHYAHPAAYAEADPRIVGVAERALAAAVCAPTPARVGRPTRHSAKPSGPSRRRARKGVLAVEMEAAALYTFAAVRKQAVLCLAHVTNTMGLAERDFEKGEADGTTDALKMLETLATALRPTDMD